MVGVTSRIGRWDKKQGEREEPVDRDGMKALYSIFYAVVTCLNWSATCSKDHTIFWRRC